MTKPQTVWLLTNSASGSNDPAAVAAVASALLAARAGPGCNLTIPEDDLPDRAALEAGHVDLLVIYTGDGTANAAVTRLSGWEGKVLVLPGGTQNLLARSLHGDRAAAEIIADLGRGELTSARRHLVRNRHGDGLCEIVAGPGATWSEVREALREGAVAELAAATRDAVTQTTTGPNVQVADPPLGKAEGYPAVRLYPVGDAISVDGYGADTLADYARQGLAILQRDFRQGPHDELGVHREVICRSDAPIELMIDGERISGGTEERFVIAPCEVTLLASRDNAEG